MTVKSSRPNAVKYLSNKELLAEIARCKRSYCTFTEPRYSEYDAIVSDVQDITPEYLNELVTKLNAKLEPEDTPKEVNGLVFRVMTYDHVPLDPERKRKSRATNQSHARTNFPPFKHFLLQMDGDVMVFTEVGRSHWKGSFEDGEFTVEKGRMSERLGIMFMKLVEKYSNRANWRGYSYRQDMQGLALMHLSQVGLQFDESKSNNPFAFYTTTITHCFTRLYNLEKKNQNIRDDLLVQMGMSPSYTKQIENEMSQSGITEPKALPAKRGRKSAAQQAALDKAEKERKSAKDNPLI